MTHKNINISESEKFILSYNELISECKKKFKVKDAWLIDLDKSKVSRLYNGQFDILTLIEIASFIGINTVLTFKNR